MKTMKPVLHLMVAVAALATTQFCTVSAATLYVDVNSTNATAPYTNWATAATVIQDAVDAAAVGDEIVVTNGVYATGGREPEYQGFPGDRVAVDKPLTLRSVKGPEFTIIQGAEPLLDEQGDLTNEPMRCVYLTNNASLSGFTLTNGGAKGVDGNGGGVYCESEAAVVTNCVLTGNRANTGGGAYGGTLNNCTLTGNWVFHQGGGAVYSTLNDCKLTANSAFRGGGASQCTLNNCTLTENLAVDCEYSECNVPGRGGGAYGGTLYNCTLSGNSAMQGGGTYGGTLYNCTLSGNSALLGDGACGGTLHNCIVHYNASPGGANYTDGTTLNYCCTTPLPTNGIGNITGPPLFMDLTEGDFRLSEDSPCIDAGANLALLNIGYAYEPTDILGNTRFIDGNGDGKVAWDIGAYEFNSFKPPRFKVQPQLTPDGWKLNITGEPNKWMRLQRSGDFKNWEDIWFGWMGPESVKEINDRQSYEEGQGAMFYRAVVP